MAGLPLEMYSLAILRLIGQVGQSLFIASSSEPHGPHALCGAVRCGDQVASGTPDLNDCSRPAPPRPHVDSSTACCDGTDQRCLRKRLAQLVRVSEAVPRDLSGGNAQSSQCPRGWQRACQLVPCAGVWGAPVIVARPRPHAPMPRCLGLPRPLLAALRPAACGQRSLQTPHTSPSPNRCPLSPLSPSMVPPPAAASHHVPARNQRLISQVISAPFETHSFEIRELSFVVLPIEKM